MDADALKMAEALIEATGRRALRSRDPLYARDRAAAAREEADLARRALVAGGLDLQRLDTLAAERSKARRQRADQAHARAVEASGAAGRRLAGLTPPLTLPADPSLEIIQEVTFIRSFGNAGTVLDSNIGTADNRAKYRISGSSGGADDSDPERLSFFTLWQNQHGRTINVAAGARLVVSAYVGVDASGQGVAGWFGFSSEARATVRARTTVWAVSDSNVNAIVSDRELADIEAHGGVFGGDDSVLIEFNEFLSATGFLVPDHAYILIEVELMTEWFAANGSVALDAASGAFQVAVPHLILTLT
jgi:hypothetical protein